jgi:predicted N-acetyltransferase YhbS
MDIKKFDKTLVEPVERIIRENLMEVNSKDYPSEIIDKLVESFTANRIIEDSKDRTILVALEKGTVIGTGGLANFGDKNNPKYYGVAVFVDIKCQGKGVGRRIMTEIENIVREKGQKTIYVRAAIGARLFYESIGYRYSGEALTRDEMGNYLMEKAL